MLHCTVLRCTVLRCAALHRTALCCAALHRAAHTITSYWLSLCVENIVLHLAVACLTLKPFLLCICVIRVHFTSVFWILDKLFTTEHHITTVTQWYSVEAADRSDIALARLCRAVLLLGHCQWSATGQWMELHCWLHTWVVYCHDKWCVFCWCYRVRLKQ